MATTYNAKLDVSCVKQHVCRGCEAEYEYTLERNVSGSGGTQEAAAANAEKAALKALEDDVDQHACPYCGMLQPDMIASVRSTRYIVGMWLGPIVLLVAFFLALPQLVTIATSAMIAVGGVALSLLLFVSGIFFNPNRDMASQQLASSDKIQAGQLKMNREGNTTAAIDDFSTPRSGHWLALGMALTALLAVVVPLVLPVVSDWPTNSSYPSIVGPGDTTCIYFDQEISSLKGYWQGSARVKVENDSDFEQVPDIRGTTKNSSWGDTISGKSVRNESHAMWVEVEIPGDPTLAGQTVDLELSVNALYPYEMNGGFDELKDLFVHSETLHLAGMGSGTLFWRTWIFGQVAAGLLLLTAGLVLYAQTRRLRETANPPNILVAEEEQEVTDHSNDEDDDIYDDDLYDDDLYDDDRDVATGGPRNPS